MSLARLLAAWRETHDEALEPLIDAAGVEAAKRLPPIAGKRGAEFEAAWLALAAEPDPGVVDVLLAAPVPAWQKLRTRCEALAKRAPDPRITRTMAALAGHYPYQQHQPLHRVLGPLIARAPTVACKQVYQVMSSTGYRDYYGTGLVAYRKLERTAAPKELLALARPAGTVDALWAQFRVAPDDLAHRAVLADALQAADDPRGELIALQLAPETPASKKRIDALLKAHRAQWLGRLPWTKYTPPPFEQGFPVAIRVLDHHAIVPTADTPEWLTIDTLDVTNAGEGDDLAPILRVLPRIAYLRTSGRAATGLQKTGPWPQLRALDLNQHAWWPPREVFPTLRMLSGHFDDDWLARAVKSQIPRVVQTNVRIADIAAIVEARAKGPAEFGFSTGHTGVQPVSWCVLVRRDDDSADVGWCGRGISSPDEKAGPAVLDAVVAGGITTLRVHGSGLDKAIAKHAKRGIAITAGAPFDVSRS